MTNNTVSCDRINGTCSCKGGWEGETCGSDVDECTKTNNACTGDFQTCENSAGSYRCTCTSNAVQNANGVCVQPETGARIAVGVNVTVNLTIDFDDQDRTSVSYLQVKQQAAEAMNRSFSHVPGFVDVVILSVRKGSIIIETEVVLTKHMETVWETAVGDALRTIATKGVRLGQQIGTATVNVGQHTLTSKSTACEAVKALGYCSSPSDVCEDQDSGVPICSVAESKGSYAWKIVVGVCVGVPCLAIIAGLIACIALGKKTNKTDTTSSEATSTHYNYICHDKNVSVMQKDKTTALDPVMVRPPEVNRAFPRGLNLPSSPGLKGDVTNSGSDQQDSIYHTLERTSSEYSLPRPRIQF